MLTVKAASLPKTYLDGSRHRHKPLLTNCVPPSSASSDKCPLSSALMCIPGCGKQLGTEVAAHTVAGFVHMQNRGRWLRLTVLGRQSQPRSQLLLSSGFQIQSKQTSVLKDLNHFCVQNTRKCQKFFKTSHEPLRFKQLESWNDPFFFIRQEKVLQW